MTNVATITINQALDVLLQAIRVELETGYPQPCYFISEPGAGKTTLAHLGHEIITGDYPELFSGGVFVWSTSENNAIDKGGLYKVVEIEGELRTIRAPISEFDWSKPVMILIDEFSNCPKHEQGGWYRLFLERTLGEHKLAPGSYVFAAGNRVEDNAAAREVSTAIKGRCQCYTIRADWKSTHKFAIANNWDERLTAFIRAYGPEFIDDGFDPEAPYAGSTGRDFDRLNAMEKAGGIIDDVALQQCVSCIDHQAGERYAAFRKLTVPNPSLVFDDPENAPIPEDPSELFLYTALVASACDASNKQSKACFEYSKRLGRTFGFGLMWDVKARHPKVAKRDVWVDVVLEYQDLA